MLEEAINNRTAAPLRYRVSRSLNLFLAKQMRMPRVPAIRIARALNMACTPLAQVQRRRIAKELIEARRQAEPAIRIDGRDGYAFVAPDALPEIAPAIAEAREAYQRTVEAEALTLGHGGTSRKTFMRYASDGAATARLPAIMKLATARPLIDAVSEYLGEVPLIGNASILVSMPNESQVGSQLYHLDFADEKQVKLFVYADLVTPDSGPFTFTSIPVTDRLLAAYRYDRGRLSIEQVREAVGPENEIQVTGPAGTALLCDTSRCMHYGSNRNVAVRIVVLIQYVAHAVPEQPPAVWPVDDLARQLQLDDIQRLALTV
jgi:hypothetical protein